MYAVLTVFSLAVLEQAEAGEKEGAEFAKAQQKKWNEFYRTEAAADAVWHFGAGRFTDLDLKLRHKQEVLWNYDCDFPLDDERSPYISRRTELRNRVIP